MPPVSLLACLRAAITQLGPVSDSPRLDAEVLLAHCLGKPRSFLLAWPEYTLAPEQAAGYATLIERRRQGEPIAYLLGYREFWTFRLAVNHATLIPRPETEHLVELALQQIPPERELTVADLGTGSGAIALAIAQARPRCRVWATDISAACLAIARQNAQNLGCTQIEFMQAPTIEDWYSALPDIEFDLILSNPPYIAAGDHHLLQGDVRFEPATALVAGNDGLQALRHIISAAPRHLRSGGGLFVEHGYDQASSVVQLLHAAGLQQVVTHRDFGGQDRVSCGYWRG